MSQSSKRGSGGSGGSGIETIAGDVGSITGSNVTIFANQAANNSGATVAFVNSGTISTLNVTDSGFNTAVGKNAGSLNFQDGRLNSLFGSGAGLNISGTGGQATSNNAFGEASLVSLTTGSNNAVIGSSLNNLINGNSNVALGNDIAQNLTSGTGNLFAGTQVTGDAYTSNESYNILFQNQGVLGESNTMRLGTQGSGGFEIDRTFIAGIVGNTVSNAQAVTIDSTSGQLGVVALPTPTVSVSFSAYQSAPTTNQTGDSTVVTPICDTVLTNIGSGYNSATGVFTVPAGGAGNYQFNIDITFNGIVNSAATQCYAGLIGTNFNFWGINYDNLTAVVTSPATITFSQMLPMAVGDTMTLKTMVAGTTKSIGIFGSDINSSTAQPTMFSGFRIP